MINLSRPRITQKEQSHPFRLTVKAQTILTAWVFILPSLLGFLIFYIAPTARGFAMSLTEWDLLTPAKFVGLNNFVRLFQDAEFWHSLRVTAYYVLWNIPLETALAVVIGVLMHRLTKSVMVRAMIILPWLISQVTAALIWQWLLDPQLGIIDSTLRLLNLPPQPFLGSVDQAIPTIAMINIWRHTGYLALLIFAGLQTIPKEIYEAAAIDGASELRSFWSVTLPLLRPVIAFVMVTSVVGAFQVIDGIAVTTKGGPVDATRVIYWFIYQHAFERFKFSYATTGAFALFLILFGLSVFQMRAYRADESDLA